MADEVFGPAEWSTQARKDSAPVVLGDLVVVATDRGVTALDAKGKEQWRADVDLLPDPARPDGVRDLIPVTHEVVAVIDKGTLPKGSDPLASEIAGTRITLLSVKDGSEIAAQALPGEKTKRTTGLAFETPGDGITAAPSDIARIAITPTGEVVTETEGKVPVGTVGEHIVWATPYTANMGVNATSVADVPLELANLQASDGREIAVLSSYDGKTTTTLWWNLANGTPLTPDASCPAALIPKTLAASSDGAFVVGDSAIADVKAGTVTCTGGGADQKSVLWWAVTDDGTAYGQTADANDTLVIGKGGEITTHPIPAEAAMTRLAGFASDGTAILFSRDAGIVNGNPVKG
ncbi:hypothetical protein G3N30_11595 [Microbacterium lacticum]|uniref:hypothetical protein n=1 Tax=Microbacterium lacticum TaxID=33885 RepID=UPI0018B0C9DF|nr:hypothetical protein [Microbacterium lacticum]MBF9336832.1 hypothetical protein [Microbacterium lacticum]